MKTHDMKSTPALVFAALAVLGGGAALGYLFASRNGAPIDVAVHPAETRKVLYWRDPMVPNAKFDKPGKSPFMDMQLVPVYAEEGAVRVSADARQNLGIRIGVVEARTAPRTLDVVGAVAFDERLLEVVQARVEGYVTRLYVKAPFVQVRKGEPLAEILSPAWLAAQQEYLALLEEESGAVQALRAAARQRLGVLGVPEAMIDKIEASRATDPATTVRAPIDGVVTELAVREGAAFAPGSPLFRINGFDTVWVNAQTPEAHVALVTVGSSVAARATAWPGEVFEGKVIALLPQVDPQTRTLTARVALDNTGGRLAPGMFVSLRFTDKQAHTALVVPSEAVIATGRRSVVVVAREDGAFDVAEVTIGVEREGETAILAGLDEGQSVVLSGQFLIDSEASLRATLERITAVDRDAQAQP